MKTYLLVAVMFLLVLSGCTEGQTQGTPRTVDPGSSGQVSDSGSSSGSGQVSDKPRTIRVRSFQFGFDPETITVKKGEKIKLLMTTSDVRHGFAIPEYGIDVVISPGDEIPVELVADKPGTFTGYCTVPCGKGHSNMRAKLVVTE